MTETKKTLYRLPKQGKIFGVCAGIADSLNMDVTLIRIIFVVMTFATGGAIILLYIIFAIVLPVPGDKDDTINEKVEKLGQNLKDSKFIIRSRNYMGIGLIIILGVWLLLRQLFPHLFDLRWGYIWPMLLIFVGFIIIARRGHDR